MARRLRSVSQNQGANQYHANKEMKNLSQLLEYWGKPEEQVKLPALNVIEKNDFYQYDPFEIKYKIVQNHFVYNNTMHKEFEIKFINDPEQMKETDIYIEQKVSISSYSGKPTFSTSDYQPSITFYSGYVSGDNHCLYQIEQLPEHLVTSSRTLRSIFYHYYFNYKNDDLPLLTIYKVPLIFKAKQVLRFKVFPDSISGTLTNGLVSLTVITERYVPLLNLLQKKLESGKWPYDQKLYIVMRIFDLIERLEQANIISLDLGLENILITQDQQFKISTINLCPYIQLSVYKENASMYESYHKNLQTMNGYRSKAQQPPEVKRRDLIVDYRAITRYHLGLVVLQIYYDIPQLQYLDELKIQTLIFQLSQEKNGSRVQSQQSQIESRPPSQQIDENPLASFIKQLLSGDPNKRLEKSLTELIQISYQPGEFEFDGFNSFFAEERAPLKSYNSVVDVEPSPVRSKEASRQDTNQYNIAIIKPSEEIEPVHHPSQSIQQYVRQKNLIAEIHFNFYLFQQALDQWQYIFQDVEEAFGPKSVEYEYLLERLWLLAEYVLYQLIQLGDHRVLDQISDKYLKNKKTVNVNPKAATEFAYLLQEQAKVKHQLGRLNDSIHLYKQANKEFLKLKLLNEVGANTTTIGILYAKCLDFEKARQHLELAVFIFTKMEKSSIVPMLIAQAWQIEDQEDTVSEPINRIKFWTSLLYLAKFYYDDSKYTKAQGVLLAAMEVYAQIKKNNLQYEEFLKSVDLIILSFSMLSHCYLEINQYDEAHALVEEGMALKPNSLAIKPLLDIKVEILIYKHRVEDALSVLGLWTRNFQREHKFTQETAAHLKAVADLAFTHKQTNVAFSFYSEALSIYKNIKTRQNNQEIIRDIELNLQQLF